MSLNTRLLKSGLGLLISFIFSITTQTALANTAPDPTQPAVIKILGVNDFHGQISTGRRINNRPVGSAAVLAAYLKQAQKSTPDSTLFALMGDQVGASPPASGLLHDEPSILFFNSLANEHCHTQLRMDPQCNMVATVGNHEFDKGQQAMFTLMYGSDAPPTDAWISLPHYPGASFPFVSANILDAKTQQPLFPPYVIKEVQGVRIAFIGAILKNAPAVILPTKIEGIQFTDEAEAINRYLPEIKAKGVNTIVVIIHQGGYQAPYEGPTKEDTKVEGSIVDIVKQLDDSIDVVMTGHTHQFVNAFINNLHGKRILVTQANSYSTSFAEVTLTIDRKTDAVLKKSAKIIATFADQWPGTSPDQPTEKLINLAEEKTAPIINSQIGILKENITKSVNAAGESSLGDLITDAARHMMHADLAVINPGGMRADLYAGKLTWGHLYAAQPFSNYIVKLTLSGADIYNLLEQQWNNQYKPTVLQISGFTYQYDSSKPVGNRIIAVYYNNQPLIKDKLYNVATNDFLAGGGDGFSVMKKGKIIETGGTDLEALIQYIKTLPQPISVAIDGRIKQVR